MSRTLRTRKNGEKVYEIRIYRGLDPETGRQLTSFSTIFHIPEGLTPEEADAEAARAEEEFRRKCVAGLVAVKKETRNQAEKAIRKLPKSPTYQEYLPHFLKRCEEGLSSGTVKSYRLVLERACPALGSLKLKRITETTMRDYFISLREDDGLRHSTRNQHFTILQMLFTAAVEDGILRTSPMEKLSRPQKQKESRSTADGSKRKAYTDREVAHILACLQKEPLKWRAAVIFMLDSGCSSSEAAGLRWQDIDLSTGDVHISNALKYQKGKGVYDVRLKNSRDRSFVLTAYTISVLKEWKSQQAGAYRAEHVKDDGYCFARADGCGMDPTRIREYFRQFAAKYDIPNFTSGALQETMITIALKNGAEIISISKKLGHAQLSTTLNLYGYLLEDADRRTSRILDACLFGG